MPYSNLACTIAAFDNDQCAPDQGGIEAVAFGKLEDLSSATFTNGALTAVTVASGSFEVITATQGDATTFTVEAAERANPTVAPAITATAVLEVLKMNQANLLAAAGAYNTAIS